MATATPAVREFVEAAAPTTVLAPAAASPPPTVRQDSLQPPEGHRQTALSPLPAQPNFGIQGSHAHCAAGAASPAAITPAMAALGTPAYGAHPAKSVRGTPAAAFAHKPLLPSTPATEMQQESAQTPAGQDCGAHTSPRSSAPPAGQAGPLRPSAAPAAGTGEASACGQPGADTARLAPVPPDQIATATLCSPQLLRVAPLAPLNEPAVRQALPEEATHANASSTVARSPQAAEISEGPTAALPEEHSLGDTAQLWGKSGSTAHLACAPRASLSCQTGQPAAACRPTQLPTQVHHTTEATPPVPAPAAPPRRFLTQSTGPKEAPAAAAVGSPPVPALAAKLRRLPALPSPEPGVMEAPSAVPEPSPAPITGRVPAASHPLPETTALQAVESDAEVVLVGETTEPQLDAADTAESLPASSRFLLPASPPVPAVAAALRRVSLPTTNAAPSAPAPKPAADPRPPGARPHSPEAQVSKTLRPAHLSRLEVCQKHSLRVVHKCASIS